MVVVVFVFVVDYSKKKKKKKKKRCLVVVLVVEMRSSLSLLFLKHEEEAAQFKEQRAKLRAFVRANSALFCFERKREKESSRKATLNALVFRERLLDSSMEEDELFLQILKTLNVMCCELLKEGRRVNANYALPNNTHFS